MIEAITLARPYAKAAFKYAVDHQALSAWAEMLTVLTEFMAQPEVVALLARPGLNIVALTEWILTTLAQQDFTPEQVNFIRLLADNRRLNIVAEINRLFAWYKDQHERKVEVEVAVPFALPPALQAKLAEVLRNKLQQEILLKVVLDKSLIGGAKIKAADWVIDGSVRGKIAQLASAIA